MKLLIEIGYVMLALLLLALIFVSFDYSFMESVFLGTLFLPGAFFLKFFIPQLALSHGKKRIADAFFLSMSVILFTFLLMVVSHLYIIPVSKFKQIWVNPIFTALILGLIAGGDMLMQRFRSRLSQKIPETISFVSDRRKVSLNVDDIVETVNHFRCIDYIIDKAGSRLSENFIRHLHCILKTGTSDSRKDWFAVGEYKRIPNEVGGHDTCPPEQVHAKMKELLSEYNSKKRKTFEDILDFHVRFERIHPFQDGNGRVGRLVMFKECLDNAIVPFIITDELKMFYYRGLDRWGEINGYLTDTCLTAQDQYKSFLDYFRIGY